MNNFKNFFLTLPLLFTFACGGGTNPDKDSAQALPEAQSVSGEKFHLIGNSENLVFGDESLSGSGSIRFAEDLGSVLTGYSYKLTFELDDEAELTLHSHSNTELEQGFDIRFKRSGNALQVFGTASGNTQNWTEFFQNIDATQSINIAIDVHNNEPLTHIIFVDENTETELLDTAEDIDGGPGNGFGQNWGLSLSNAHVTEIQKGPPEHGHEHD